MSRESAWGFLRRLIRGRVPLSDGSAATPQHEADEIARLKHDLHIASLNIKTFGYELAARAVGQMDSTPPTAPIHVGLTSQPTRQADIESDWARYWLGRLGWAPIYHRKLWELSFVLQVLFENGMLESGRRGLGFAVGTEPVASLLASYGVHVTLTDISEQEARRKGWVHTGQHMASLEQVRVPHLISAEAFAQNASLRTVDMNAIPYDLRDFDFCWSICAVEHLGSISHGLDFLENCLETLKPGGVSVHTTEYNFFSDTETLESGPTVLFLRRHLEEIAARLRAKGHHVAELDFDTGGGPIDTYIDLPPYPSDIPAHLSTWNKQVPHLKLALGGYASTCFGLIVRKAA